jgi:hypothetical protein
MQKGVKIALLTLLVAFAFGVSGCHEHNRRVGFHTDYDNHYYGANHPNEYWTY